jgi:hypothetical protein
MDVVIFGVWIIIVYKHGRTHVVVDALSRLPDNSKPLGVPN